MNTSFAKFEPFTYDFTPDHPSFYHIETFDNGVSYRLDLVHTRSNDTVSMLSLEGKCFLDNIDPIWHNHKVIVANFDRDCYTQDAPQEVIDEIKQQFEARNQMTVVEFLKDHNDREDRIDEAVRKHAIRTVELVTFQGV